MIGRVYAGQHRTTGNETLRKVADRVTFHPLTYLERDRPSEFDLNVVHELYLRK